jgi:hypothetical protein
MELDLTNSTPALPHVCSVVWTLVAALCTALIASVQTLGKLAVLTWIGFASIFTAVFIIV